MDLDGDGHLDVISGRYNPGVVTWYRGTADGFTKGERLDEQPLEEHGDGTAKKRMDMRTAMATANFADWDGDGDFDMIVGNVRGHAWWNRNVGDAKKPRFGRREQLVVNGEPLRVTSKSDPLPVDWDGDGKLDLLVGDELGDVTFFRGLGAGRLARGVSVFSRQPKTEFSYFKAKESFAAHRKIPGYRLRLAVDDWNEDGKLDLLIGNCEQVGKRETTGNVYVLLRK